MKASETYAANLEKKLIEEFKEKFFDKLGYEPVVITKVHLDEDHALRLMSMQELAAYIEDFVPVADYGKKYQLFSKCRKRELVELRMIFCFIARSMKYQLASIGRFMGGRDHTTVIHNIGQFKNLIETDYVFKQKYSKILHHISKKHESPDLDKLNQVEHQSQPVVLP